jgi:hypothetical protein
MKPLQFQRRLESARLSGVERCAICRPRPDRGAGVVPWPQRAGCSGGWLTHRGRPLALARITRVGAAALGWASGYRDGPYKALSMSHRRRRTALLRSPDLEMPSVGYPSNRTRMLASPVLMPEGTTRVPLASSRRGFEPTPTALTTWSGCVGRTASSARAAGRRAAGASPTAALSARPAGSAPRPRRGRSSIAPAPRSPSGSPPAGCSPRRRTASRRCR